MKLFYSPDYVLAGYAFDTTRKARWIADSLVERPLTGIEVCAPAPLTESQLCEAHDAAYVRAVRTGEPRALAESQGFAWDAALWRMVMASNGGAVAAARAALVSQVAGSLSSGLHHARRGAGAGFCTFNGLALAARAALEAGASSVLIVDLDAHCGGGTYSLIGDDPRIRQLDVAVSSFDAYQATARTTLDLVQHADSYLSTIERRLADVDRQGTTVELCLYNAGMDPFEGCAVGGLDGITREVLARREQMVFAWCRRRGTPISCVLAGGYVGPRLSQNDLVGLHRLTLEAATGAFAG